MKKCFIGLGSNERTADDKARGIVKIDIDLLCYDGEVLKPQDWLRVDVREGVAELASS